jgi:hypothetical protein
MATSTTPWSDPDAAAKEFAGNWRRFENFAWHRAHNLDDADRWAIFYTSNRDSGLLDESNEAAILKSLSRYIEAENPDVVVERHDHWAVGFVNGISIRVYTADGTVTPAFAEFCRLKEKLEDYPLLNESDYSEREYEATLANFRSELGKQGAQLPHGWESEVYSWFDQNGHSRYVENIDDNGGWAPKAKIIEALTDLGLFPSVVIGR